MNDNILKNILLVFLYLALALFSFMLVGFPIISITSLVSDFSFSMLFNLCLNGLYWINYFLVVKNLISIIKTTNTTPFVLNNVKSLKIMGYCLFINSIFECIMGYKGSSDVGNIQILSFNGGAITPPMITCFISALMCFVIAEVFDKAIKIKEDNDLTI